MLGRVAPFVANLRSNVVAPHPTSIGEPYGTTLPLDVQGMLPNNTNNAKRHPCSIRTFRWARSPREEGSKRRVTRMAKRLKKSSSPTKTRSLVEFDSSKSKSDESNDRLIEGNNNTSHAKAMNDSSYSEGNE
jgi:hypothetical protein